MVVEQPRHAQDRIAQTCRTKIRLVRNALLIERKDVGDGGPHVDPRDRIVVITARPETGQSLRAGDALQHREPETGVRACTERDGLQAGTVLNLERRRSRKLAAMTDVSFERPRHLPPPAVIRSTPFS